LTFSAFVAAAAFQALAIGRPVAGALPVLFAAALAVFPVAILAEPPPSRMVLRRTLRALDFALFSLCLSALLAEATLRLVARVAPTPLLDRQGMDTRARERAFGFLPGQVRMGFACNSRGFYDEEFRRKSRGESRTLVASIGDSFSASSVSHPFHFTTVAERQLPDWDIANIGLPSAGPWDYLHYLREVALPLSPDAVVVNIFIGNDVNEAIRRGDGFESWLTRDSMLLYLVPRRLLRLRSEEARVAAGEAEGVDSAPASRELVPGVVGAPVLTIEQLLEHDNSIVNPLFERPTFSESAYLDIETVRAKKVCGDDAEPFDAFFAWLDLAKEAAGATPFAVMLIPDEFQVNDELWSGVHERLVKLPGGGVMPWDRDRPQRLLVKGLQSRGIPVLDLLPALRAVEPLEDGRDHLYRRRESHFNARGNRIVGAELATFLRSLKP
jgi:hypothetical protein